jgi:Fe-S-cluster-containing hydrogenase component 2
VEAAEVVAGFASCDEVSFDLGDCAVCGRCHLVCQFGVNALRPATAQTLPQTAPV